MNTTRLKLSGLSCEACVARTTRALRGVPGVESVEVTKDAATVASTENDPAPLLAAVKKAGYTAEVLP